MGKRISILILALLSLLVFSSVALAEPRIYKVKKGECLSLIGQKFGIPWREIARINNIKPPRYMVKAGQKLALGEIKLPEKKTPPPAKKAQQLPKPRLIRSPTSGLPAPKLVKKPALKPLSPEMMQLTRFSYTDTLGDRIDSTLKWTRRGPLSGDYHQRMDVFYFDIAAFPIRYERDFYFGAFYSYIKAEGITEKGYPFSPDADSFLGGAFKWFPKNSGHELGLRLGMGLSENSHWLAGIYYTNTKRKLRGEKNFSEYTIYATGISAESESLTVGLKFFLRDEENFRVFFEAQGNPLDYRFLQGGFGISDRLNAFSVGAGIGLSLLGPYWWVGPMVHPDNLFNGVDLTQLSQRIQVTDQGLVPIPKIDWYAQLDQREGWNNILEK